MTVMLLLTVVLIYKGVADGPGGTNKQLGRSGENIAYSIRRMSP